MQEWPRMILKHMIRSAMSRRCSRLSSLRNVSRSGYERCWQPLIIFVKWRWMLSIWVICEMYEGDHVVEAYSRIGRTYILNARMRLFGLRDRKQRFISAARWLALRVILFMWYLKRNLLSIVTPKSMTESTCWMVLLTKWNVWDELDEPIWRMLHLEWEICICQVDDQRWILSSCFWKLWRWMFWMSV